MSDNTVLNPGAGGDTIRDIEKGGKKTQVVTLDLGGAGAEILLTGTLPVSQAVASNIWAQSLAVTNGATSTITSIASTVAGYQIKGLIAHGTGDGYFVVQIAGLTILSGRTRSTMPNLMIILPNGIAVTTGSIVSLKVTNESGNTADYEITLLGS